MTTTHAPARPIGKAAVGALGALAVATGALESVVTPTLPLLQRELDMSPAEGALLSIVLLVTGALITPIAGTLGDRYGGKRVVVRLMAVVCAGGLVSALAPNLPVLVLGQVLQGAMVGALPLSFILVRAHLPAGESKVAIGVVSGLFVGGAMAGTLAAGPVAEGLSRHWMFALPTFAVTGATVLVHRLTPHDPPRRPQGAGIDWPGLVLLSGTLVTLMLVLGLGADLVTQPLVLLGLVVLLAAFGTGWVAVERRAASPMVDLRMLTRPAVGKSCVLTFLICVGTSAATYLVPQLFAVPADTYGFGASATAIGFFLLPGALAASVAGPISGIGVRRLGSRAVVTAGVLLMAVGLLGLAAAHTEIWHLVLGKALVALANGLCVTAMVTRTATSVDLGDTGIATGLVLVTRVIGFAVGVQVTGAILTAGTPSGSKIPAESAFVAGFVLAAAVTVLSLLVVRTMSKGVKE
ncbi:MFS transporter [Streptomyces globisporus]|uniref:Membrane transport protein n=1 Tax=Streptomyces globisporus TaxID=1908 RepID=A0ABM9GU12_STRGL|nr:MULTISPECIES: MFS transporter [Streptomyces]RDL08022.1 putative MFS family arabinose efflux permease [Streptomyces sp. HB202]WSF75933.1 MFS transporter [Streptomyces globisporus]WSQ91023.1 MFS transporter [Streptomyces globisporus]WSU80328.1 MFS transporter [Streptomyces globisporus]WSV89023.1 MFS transporter [Streptomyces globisporus]